MSVGVMALHTPRTIRSRVMAVFSSSEAAGDPAHRRSRLLFQGGNFLFWLSLYFYVPILSVYAQSMGASLALVGVMLSAYGVMQLLLRIPTGVASDALRRRKPFVLAGVALTAAGALGFLW